MYETNAKEVLTFFLVLVFSQTIVFHKRQLDMAEGVSDLKRPGL